MQKIVVLSKRKCNTGTVNAVPPKQLSETQFIFHIQFNTLFYTGQAYHTRFPLIRFWLLYFSWSLYQQPMMLGITRCDFTQSDHFGCITDTCLMSSACFANTWNCLISYNIRNNSHVLFFHQIFVFLFLLVMLIQWSNTSKLKLIDRLPILF